MNVCSLLNPSNMKFLELFMGAFKIMNRLKKYNTSIIYWWNYHKLVVTLNKIVNIIRSQIGCAYYAFNVLYIDTLL